MGENNRRLPMASLAHENATTRRVLGDIRPQSENQQLILRENTRDTQPLDLLHHLIRAEKLATRIAILRELTRHHDTRPYSAILLRCALHGIVVQRQYGLIGHYAKLISPCKDVELLTSVAVSFLHDQSFLAAPNSWDLLKALGPLDGSKPLFAALHTALGYNPMIAVAFWSQNVMSDFKTMPLPPGMLLDFIICVDQRSQSNESEPILADFCQILGRLVLHPLHRVELFAIKRFPNLLVDWLAPVCHKTLTDVAANILATTIDLHDWRQHRRVQNRLWELAVEGRALDAIVKIAAHNTTNIALVFSIAAHINLADVNVPETSILAAKAVKRMIQSISARFQTFPEALDLLAKIATAKNRQVRFWAVHGLAEEARDVATARFYLARSNNCLRPLLLAMKKDYCLRVRGASATAVCTLARDTANAAALVRRSDFVPTLVCCVWTLLEESPSSVEQHDPATSCNNFMEALLVLVSHKTADPDRLANTFHLVETLSRFGNDSNPEFDSELQRVSLQSAVLLEPFRTSSRGWF
jgi:hypothetical protein